MWDLAILTIGDSLHGMGSTNSLRRSERAPQSGLPMATTTPSAILWSGVTVGRVANPRQQRTRCEKPVVIDPGGSYTLV